MATVEESDSFSFVPSRVDGLDAVSRVVVERTRITFVTVDSSRSFSFPDIASPPGTWFSRLVRRITFRRPWPSMVGERDWFHTPCNRFFRFFTEPQITVYMPRDDAQEYGSSCFCRIQYVMLAGGYSTWDLG